VKEKPRTTVGQIRGYTSGNYDGRPLVQSHILRTKLKRKAPTGCVRSGPCEPSDCVVKVGSRQSSLHSPQIEENPGRRAAMNRGYSLVQLEQCFDPVNNLDLEPKH
jgi:hypothetical protein